MAQLLSNNDGFVIKEKVFMLDASHQMRVKEQVYFEPGNEGLRVWEAGIVMARHYAISVPNSFAGQTVVELGSGTGIVGLALLKYTRVAKVVFTDYIEEILDIIKDNIALQESPAQTAVENVDFNQESTWQSILEMERIDRLIATDVVYQAVLSDKLAKLIRAVKQKHPYCQLEVVIPNGRQT